MCNCDIKAESNFLLESLAACDKLTMDLVMYFTVNLAFVNYFDDLPDTLDAPILQNWTTYVDRFYLFLCILLSLIQVCYRHQKRNFWFAKSAYWW